MIGVARGVVKRVGVPWSESQLRAQLHFLAPVRESLLCNHPPGPGLEQSLRSCRDSGQPPGHYGGCTDLPFKVKLVLWAGSQREIENSYFPPRRKVSF